MTPQNNHKQIVVLGDASHHETQEGEECELTNNLLVKAQILTFNRKIFFLFNLVKKLKFII